MTEPILMREEAFKLAQRFEATEDNDNIPGVVALTPLELEQFLSAVLEKVCGEPIYQVWIEETSSYADVTAEYYSERLPSNRRIVYALTRSKP
ncbi:hypothetical protein KDX40_13255 [Burkholderia ambifaria]|uniref:hypothetical protein n=1 Tax=Burkholderia ambifaria TaxID=152480 RepID=UPI001B93017A|nr:hypothetical protein [Burkholderia ambifaria]MBR8344706.1 hypothetical protein [Burkholderia ambifaria]